MVTTLISMMLFAFTGAASPGPVNIIAASSSASFGFYRTLPHVLGATVAYCIVVLIAGTAFNQLIVYIPQVQLYLQYAGAIFLLYMSYKIATALDSKQDAEAVQQAPSFLEGALCQWLNPKAWLVSMSGASLFVSDHLYLLLFATVSFFMCLTGVGLWAAIGHIIQRYLKSYKQRVFFNRFMGAVLAFSVIIMLFN